MRLLYVDDDRVHTLLFAEACRHDRGIEVRTAESGEHALECIAEWTPDLLVLDLHLPDITGHALLQTLRGALGRPTLPAYLCTAEEPARVEQAAAAAGFDGLCSKPLTLDALRACRAARAGSP